MWKIALIVGSLIFSTPLCAGELEDLRVRYWEEHMGNLKGQIIASQPALHAELLRSQQELQKALAAQQKANGEKAKADKEKAEVEAEKSIDAARKAGKAGP